jgi:bifunctional enzyme CysN/CysC
MDLVNRRPDVFERIKSDYGDFLDRIGLHPANYVPACAREGENIASRAGWYDGPSLLECLEAFSKRNGAEKAPFRLPVQDIYKFTAHNDDRRIIVGTVQSGTLHIDDEVTLLPSKKKSRVRTFEQFHGTPEKSAAPQKAIGLTLADELYIKPGEMLCRSSERLPQVAARFRANLFWLGRAPLIPNKRYKIKLNAARAVGELVDVLNVMDASDLSAIKNKKQVDRHDVAECVFELAKPVAFDLSSDLETTARFVVVDQFEIAGAGIILESLPGAQGALQGHIQERELKWEGSAVSAEKRAARYRHKSKFIVITGISEPLCRRLGNRLETALFEQDFTTYYLGPANLRSGLDTDTNSDFAGWDEHIRRLGELARIITDSGLIFITALPDADAADIATLKALNTPNEIFVVDTGDTIPEADLRLAAGESGAELDAGVGIICERLKRNEIIPDYSI